MTEFVETAMRKVCRNPKCRSQLPTPVSNPREAFCARGCHTSFYLHRCIVCEAQIERRREDQKVCSKSKCRSLFRAGVGFGRYHTSSSAKLAPKTLDSIGPKQPLKPDRARLVVAGPELMPSQLHCATVPDGPNCEWKGGEFERVEAKTRAALTTAEQTEIEANGYFAGPGWREVISLDAVRCFVTRFAKVPETKRRAMPPIPDDLSVPRFLLRRPEPLAMAA